MKTGDMSYLDQVNYGKHDCFITPPPAKIEIQGITSDFQGYWKYKQVVIKRKLLDKINK